jgi:hypothetical protein
MKSAENIRKSFKELHVPTSAKLDEQIHREISRTSEERNDDKAPTPQANIWRIIIESRIVKLSAAAVVVVAVLVGLHWFGGGAPAYGITEALELWKNAETVHIKGWTFLHTGDDTQLEKFPFEFWFDRKNGRFKIWRPWGWFGDYTTETPRYYLNVSDGQYVMETSYRQNYKDNKIYPMVSFTKLSPFQQRLQMHTMKPFPSFMANLHQVKGFLKIGQEQFKNKTVEIWQGEIIAAGKTVPYSKMKIWLSPKTGEIVRIFNWLNAENDSIRWLQRSDADTIEYNVTPPAGSFRTEPPNGFKPVNPKENAIENELGDDGRGVRFYGCIGFTLKDGSVIYGWHANHKLDESQAHLFKDLSPGGPLPHLPAQIVGLKPWPLKEDVTFDGRHLAFTLKKGKFYEWGIYVTKKKMPERDTFQAYKVITKFNDTEPRAFGGRPNLIGQELTIHTEGDFDTWVRGAMAELSDDGKAPEHVSHENVLQLAEKVRNSLYGK